MTIIEPKTKEVKQWINDNVHIASWQWLGAGFAVDSRYVPDLLEGIKTAGFCPNDFEVY
jgi:hypothetical protein